MYGVRYNVGCLQEKASSLRVFFLYELTTFMRELYQFFTTCHNQYEFVMSITVLLGLKNYCENNCLL